MLKTIANFLRKKLHIKHDHSQNEIASSQTKKHCSSEIGSLYELSTGGKIYDSTKNFKDPIAAPKARSMASKILTVLNGALGNNYEKVVALLNKNGLEHLHFGYDKEAESLFREALSTAKVYLGDDHWLTGTSHNNLGLIFKNQSNYADAEFQFKKALEIAQSQFDTHSSEILPLCNLGSVYLALDRFEEAESLLEEAVAIAQASLGANHDDIRLSLGHLGALYQARGRYSEAELLMEDALEIARKSIRADHPEFAKVLHNLGSIYQDQGRYRDAERLLKEAIEITRKSIGADHPNNCKFLNSLGSLYQAQGRYSDVEPLLVEALEIARQSQPENHPDISSSLNNLGELYHDQGRYLDAEPLLEDALEIARKSLSANHSVIGKHLNNLGSLYLAQGRYSEAEPLLKEAIEIARKSIGADHPNSGIFLNNLGSLYVEQERYQDAEKLFKEALDVMRILLPPDHPSIGILLTSLGGLYHKQRMYSAALPLLVTISQTTLFRPTNRIRALTALSSIAYDKSDRVSVNRFLSDAWNLAALTNDQDYSLNKRIFGLVSEVINCWSLLDNAFKKATESSHRLRERLNLISESYRPQWAGKLHSQYTEFHVKWMQHSLKDSEPDRIPFVLSLVSGWRATQFILDEIDTTENISTLPAEVVEFKRLRLKLSELRPQIQVLTNPSQEQEAQRANFSPEGIAAQEQRLQKLYTDYDDAKNNLFRSQQELAKFPDYAALATDIGIDITELRSNLKAQEAIAICNDFSAHNFKGILLVFDESANTKTQWIHLSSFDTKDGLNRLDYFNRKFGGGRGFRRGDISSADTSSKANEEDGIAYSREDFWPEFQDYIKNGFWGALGSSLEGIKELTLITQGNMHSLPLEMGAPQNLTLVRYPSITLYNMQQKIKYEKSAADANPVIGLACSNDNGIWFAKQEVDAIAELYKSHSLEVFDNYDFLVSEENITAAHLAGHGFHNDAHAHQAGLDMGGAELWTQPKLLSSKARPKRVFISACVAGKTTENSEGDVYGIAAAFMLRGTRELTAAVVNMNDPWMFLMGYRVEEYLLNNPTHSQYTALKHAKDDLVNQKPIPLVVLNKWEERVKDDLLSIINTSAPESDGRNQQLDEFIKFNTTLQIGEEKLRKDFLTVPRRDTNNPIANYEFTFRNSPPEPILGSLLYGILHFGK